LAPPEIAAVSSAATPEISDEQIRAACSSTSDFVKATAKARDRGVNEEFLLSDELDAIVKSGHAADSEETVRLLKLAKLVYAHPEIGPDKFAELDLKQCLRAANVSGRAR
jgi:hypothetical protein